MGTAARAIAFAILLPTAAQAVEENPPPGDYRKPVVIRFEQEINDISEQYLYRKLDAAEAYGADLVIVKIDSPGGELDATMCMAKRLRSTRAHTVAYIPDYAYSGGAVLALACDDIIMAPNAHIGDIGVIFVNWNLGAFQYAPEKIVSPFIEEVRTLAKKRGQQHGKAAGPAGEQYKWPPGLADAMIDKDVVLWKVKNKDTGKTTYMTEKEIESEEKPDQWEKIKQVFQSREGKFLTVNGETAVELQLAGAVVPGDEKLYEHYQLRERPIVYDWSWVDTTVRIMNSWWVTALLFIIGLIALYIEFSMPGIGVGGLTAILCFALFFWSHALGGTAGWLEIVLFAAGLMFLAVELFVIPGFGVAGVTGVLLLLVSIVMACQDFIIPENPQQWTQLTQNLLVVAVSGVICAFAVVYLSSRMGALPLFNRLILKPPGTGEQRESGGVAAGADDSPGDVEIRVGDQGIAQSALRPAGKARFGKQYADVVTDGDFINKNSRVEIMEIVGNRIVVREIG